MQQNADNSRSNAESEPTATVVLLKLERLTKALLQIQRLLERGLQLRRRQRFTLSSKPSVDRSCLHRSLVLARVMLIVVNGKQTSKKRHSEHHLQRARQSLPWTRRMAL
jgi:hypothetical protein